MSPRWDRLADEPTPCCHCCCMRTPKVCQTGPAAVRASPGSLLWHPEEKHWAVQQLCFPLCLSLEHSDPLFLYGRVHQCTYAWFSYFYSLFYICYHTHITLHRSLQYICYSFFFVCVCMYLKDRLCFKVRHSSKCWFITQSQYQIPYQIGVCMHFEHIAEIKRWSLWDQWSVTIYKSTDHNRTLKDSAESMY